MQDKKMQGQNKCNVCNKQFASEQELREHQRTAHQNQGQTQGQTQTGEKKHDQPSTGQQQPRREDKIAS